jgi:Fe-S cluster assembly protein SufD
MKQGSVKNLEGTVGGSGAWVAGALDSAQQQRGGWQSAALSALVASAEKSWGKVLFPSTRVESWKYTSVESITSGNFKATSPGATVTLEDIDGYIVKALNPYLIVLVNGHYEPKLSTQEFVKGVTVLTSQELASGKNEERASRIGASQAHANNPFVALATALMTECVTISVDRGTRVERPIQVISVVTKEGAGAVITPRLMIEVAELAELAVIESHVTLGATSYLTIPVVESFVAESGRLRATKIELDSDDAFHVAHNVTEQGRASYTRALVFSFGGRLVRNAGDIELKGSGCDATINGLSVLNRAQHVDNTTSIHHIEPACESRELFKGIYSGESKGVFSGTIVVESEAQKTNAFQSNQTLLLSPTASIDTRPQLKIWADDVKCTHGATVGQLDEMAMFYLRSRGIDQDEAKRCLVKAFASEVVSSLECDALEAYVGELLTAKLESLRSN